MRVAHVCLSCFYIDHFGYQENELVRQHVEDGHEVVVIASTETFGDDGKLTYVQPATYLGTDGAQVIRLPYRKVLPHALMRKLRMHPGVFELLCEAKPEVILFHGLCGWELHAVVRYKRTNPTVRLYVDSHEDSNNSARSFLSKHVLHRLYYAWIIRRCMEFFDKILCISVEVMEFVQKTYGVPAQMLEFYPLGGRVFSDEEYAQRRARGRLELGLKDDQVMLLQTGKMGQRKRVLESIDAFSKTEGESLRFILAGSIDEQIRSEVMARIARDKRITFLGWKTTEQLKELLCTADVYVQPGTQSATMQMSLCARCPVVLDNVPSHRPFVDGNGWLVRSVGELNSVFKEIRDQPSALKEMSSKSLKIAKRYLDYRALAARIC